MNAVLKYNKGFFFVSATHFKNAQLCWIIRNSIWWHRCFQILFIISMFQMDYFSFEKQKWFLMKQKRSTKIHSIALPFENTKKLNSKMKFVQNSGNLIMPSTNCFSCMFDYIFPHPFYKSLLYSFFVEFVSVSCEAYFFQLSLLLLFFNFSLNFSFNPIFLLLTFHYKTIIKLTLCLYSTKKRNKTDGRKTTANLETMQSFYRATIKRISAMLMIEMWYVSNV